MITLHSNIWLQKTPNMAATKVLPLWHTTYFTIFFWPHCHDTPKSPVGERKRYETNCLFATSPNSARPDPVRFCSFSITSRDCRQPVLSSLLAYWSKRTGCVAICCTCMKKNTWITKFKKCTGTYISLLVGCLSVSERKRESVECECVWMMYL